MTMDKLPSGMSKEKLQRQIEFALLMRKCKECARNKECPSTSCICSGNDDFLNCEEADLLLADLPRSAANHRPRSAANHRPRSAANHRSEGLPSGDLESS
jgi:hypothetical protein